jgi:CBS domain containing-hemolysin-like protein
VVAELTPVLIIVVLLAANALFVAAEFAIVSVPRTAIERRAQQGNRVARLVRGILADPRRQDRFIATAQLGITVASLGLGMYGEHVLADWIFQHLSGLGSTLGGGAAAGVASWLASHSLATVLSVAALTYLHIVFGEMIPKSLALQSAEKSVLWITPAMKAIYYAVYPIVIALNATGNLMLRLVGINRSEGSSDHHYSPEELSLIIDESEEGGQLRAEAGQMLRELFAFSDTSAREAMVPRVRVTGIEVGSAPDDVRRIAMVSGHTRYPVFDGDLDHIVGYIHIKELVAVVDAGRIVTGRDAHPIPQVPDTATLDDVLAMFRRHAAPMAVVFDEHGGTAGVITLEDLFYEVAGDIPEGSAEVPSIAPDGTGGFRVEGTVRIDKVGEALGCELEHPDVDSVSGLVLAVLGRLPVVGEAVEYDHVRFEVTRVERHGVGEARVSHVVSPSDDED